MKVETRKGLKSAIKVIAGFVMFIWFFTPVLPWKGFVVFACSTVALLALMVVYLLLGDDDEVEEMKT